MLFPETEEIKKIWIVDGRLLNKVGWKNSW